MHMVFAVVLVVLGAFLTLGFRRVGDWFDRVLRTLAGGPGAPEPERRSVVGQWAMVGTGSSTAARWYPSAATLLVGLGFLVVGIGALAGAERV